MKFTDICLVTKDVPALVQFYETIFNTKAEGDSTHSVVNAAGLSIAIYNKTAAETDMSFNFEGAGSGYVFIGFNVDDVDVEYTRVRQLNISNPTEPRVWPWGAKSFHFKDPDGNFVTFRSFPGVTDNR
ncbi:MAG: VOC family protein [Thermoclostridium sp.]|jgi:predicted enzyme related to lactoylglutathione lyase|nr:VOC family protein [Thermoclostridium sp.]